jgi:hypothetical protein
MHNPTPKFILKKKHIPEFFSKLTCLTLTIFFFPIKKKEPELVENGIQVWF